MLRLDVIVPVRNEEGNIEEFCKRIDAAMHANKINYRVILVVDPSTDQTEIKAWAVAKKFPVLVHVKKGTAGKAFSILEGISLTESDIIAMIDGDLQYPPEALVLMYQRIISEPQVGVIVAKRVKQDIGKVRKLGSRLNHLIFNKFILGYKVDVQSGLKVFKKEIVPFFQNNNIQPWTIDAEILYAATELGYKIGEIEIEFSARNSGLSKVNFLSTAISIASESIKIRLRKRQAYHLPPTKVGKMLGAGIAFNRQKFITHSTLQAHSSAVSTFVPWQKTMFVVAILSVVAGLAVNFTITIIGLIAILSIIYFIDVFFTLFLVLKSLHFPPELTFSEDDLKELSDKDLPVYSVLCPLYKEASVLPQFLENIDRLDYPKNKLDVLLLLEENDTETIEAAEKLNRPDYLRIIIVPHSMPKTKPKAANYGLSMAQGEFVVVYDAEDQPEPMQLKKAVLGFSKSAKNVACLQAKLNYYNPSYNLLTRLFTAEYSLWFDLVLPALQSIDTTIPLGGTSNHFRTRELIELHGWDAFNVTEDCDLGARLFKVGKKTAIIDSVTLEEANSDTGNWIRQRSRWIKGYFQTYLVHMRNPIKLVQQLGWHALIFQLVIGARTTFMLINPILWIATISYFTLYSIVGPTIESLYPAPIFYMAVFSLAAGNFVYLYNYMIGCAKRGQWELIKFVFLVPVYWLFVSIAAIKAFIQLLYKPHYWEKTNHGLHLGKPALKQETTKKRIWLPKFVTDHPLALSGGVLIGASLATNFLFLLGSTFISRSNATTFDQLGVLGLTGSFLAIFDVFTASFGKTIVYQTGFFLGKYQHIVKDIWKRASLVGLGVGFLIALSWVVFVPTIGQFFHTPLWPLYIFAPVLVLAVLNVTNNSFLLGGQKFVWLSIVMLTESLTKLIFSVVVVMIGRLDLLYATLPLSIFISVLVGLVIISRFKNKTQTQIEKTVFPTKFFVSSIALKISLVLFFGADVVLAKHLLSPTDAGQYALLTSIGKMVFIFGGLFTQFITPLIAKSEGEKKNSSKQFKIILVLTIICSTLMGIIIGPLGSFVVPFVFGQKALSITAHLIPYAVAMATLAVSGAIVNYHQVKKHYFFTFISLIFAALQAVAIFTLGTSVSGIVLAVTLSAGAYLLSVVVIHACYGILRDSKNNLWDLINLLFHKVETNKFPDLTKLSILIFNWRDTKHVWAGGAEVYIQEISKRWVSEGHNVTIFCGHDGKNSRNEIIDGVTIIRRGGFSFVYIWAAIYYLVRLKGKFDVIIDCENGIPFFTPLFAKEKVILLIHAVHQEVFKDGLSYPKYLFATFLEKKVMPLVYRNVQVVTVSASSKADILEHKLTTKEPIIVHNGVDLNFYKPSKKSATPLVVYIGRLKKHKSLEVFIKMAKRILVEIPSVEFVVAGDGPDKEPLTALVKSLGLEDKVKFLGKVSEDEKLKLYQKSWVFVNPSMKEGWGITSIEANACGTPVVASNVPGLRDSVDNPHTGFLVPFANDERFAERVVALINNKQFRIKTGKYAIEWAKKFSWDRSAEEFIKVLKT